MEEKPNYYSVLPANVRYDKDLQPNAKILYSEITSLCNHKGYCFAGNNYFANLYDVDKATISRWISKLVKKKYVFIKMIKKKTTEAIEKRIICLEDIPIDEIINTYMQKNQYPIDEKVKDNNISNNSSNNIENELPTSELEQFQMSDEIFLQIFPVIEKEFGRMISPIEIEMIKTWDYSFDILKLALSEAVTKGQFSMKYIDRIIYNWKKANVRTIAEARKYIDNFNNRNSRKCNQPMKQTGTLGTDYYDGYEVF